MYVHVLIFYSVWCVCTRAYDATGESRIGQLRGQVDEVSPNMSLCVCVEPLKCVHIVCVLHVHEAYLLKL